MAPTQPDLFLEDRLERETLPYAMIAEIRARLETVVSELERADVFPWEANRLEAVHVENRFRGDADRLGDDGTALWARFDRAMDRLFAIYNEGRDPEPSID
jgi:hypothetical protein